MRLALIPALAALPALVQAEPEAAIATEVDAAFARYAALPSTLVPILEQAKDKASADAAAQKLFDALPAVYEAREGLHAIEKLDPAQTRLVQQKYGAAMQRDWGRLFEHIYRLQKAQCYGSIPFFKQFRTLCMMLEK